MPSRYRRDAQRLKAEILARVGAGERLPAVCGGAGMPGAETVRNWARADAGFGEALAAARRWGDWRRVCAFDEGKAAAFLARVAAGETIHSLIGSAGMPSRRTYNYWRATQAPFAEAVFRFRQRRDEQIGEQARARRRGFDQRLADRVVVGLNKGLRLEAVLAADPELPCRPVLARWRREQPEFDRVLRLYLAAWRRRRGAAAARRSGLAHEIVDHIIQGGSFASFSRRPGGPSRTTLRRWFRADPDFAAAVRRACAHREEWYEDQIRMIAERPAGSLREMKRSAGPLLRHLVRLRHRPGAVHRRRPDAG